MPEPTAVLWDIGGVLLSDGFDEGDRAAAAQHFGIDPVDFERRHHAAVGPFERGQLTLDEYLDQTIFFAPRPFRRDEVKEFIFGRSHPHAEVIEVARAVASSPGRLSGCLNNESRELNEYRLNAFDLRRIFSVYLSSCYTGRRKPDAGAYQLAIDVLGRPPGHLLFIDDRLENLAPATALGLQTIHYRTPGQLRSDLNATGVHW